MKRYKYYTESTIPGIFRNRARFYGNETFLKSRDSKTWHSISWLETMEKVDSIATWLMEEGINPGDKISIYSENRPEWVFADLASLSIGATDVTVYPTNLASEASYIIDHSDSKMCFCSGKYQVDNLLSVRKELPNLEKIIVFDDEKYDDSMVVNLGDILESYSKKINEQAIEERIDAINPDSPMTIMYTSGTTGKPKGVMLSAGNILSEVKNFIMHQPHPKKEIILSILPLSHALERSIGYYLMMYGGGEIAFSRGPDDLLEDLVEIRPTSFITVPRIPEKIYEGIMLKVSQASFIKKLLFNRSVNVARKAAFFLKQNEPLTGRLKIQYKVAQKLVLSKLVIAIGLDRMSCFGSGGAPLSSEVHDFFCGLGIFLLPGYGLTETSPVTHSHTFRYIHPIKTGSVGLPLPLVECKIADDGEILIRGPQVMKGYYKNEEATNEVFNEDGFFLTGDIGHVDEDNYLFITDRKKDIIITSGGKNISPQEIEGMFSINRYIGQILLIGDQKKFVVALVVPDFDNLKLWADQNKISYTEEKDLINNDKVQGLFNDIIEKTNKGLGRVEQIKKFKLLPEPFSQENGELTPTLKIKRRAVQDNYKEIIEEMYKQ